MDLRLTDEFGGTEPSLGWAPEIRVFVYKARTFNLLELEARDGLFYTVDPPG